MPPSFSRQKAGRPVSYPMVSSSFVQKPLDFAEFTETVARLGLYSLATNTLPSMKMMQEVQVFLIEDDEADFLLVDRHIRQSELPAMVRWVRDAGQLRAALDEGGWDVVLSDYNVPGLDFVGVLEVIRQRLPDQPIILVSGSIGEEIAVELLKSGLCDFVLKDRLQGRRGQWHLRRCPRYHRTETGRRGAKETSGATESGPEDGIGGAAGRRGGPRFQQYAECYHRLCRAGFGQDRSDRPAPS